MALSATAFSAAQVKSYSDDAETESLGHTATCEQFIIPILDETNPVFPHHMIESLNQRMRYPKMGQATIKALQKAPSNGWIAFSEDEEHLVAYGATYDEVVANAEKQGAADLVVVKVPETRIYRVRRG